MEQYGPDDGLAVEQWWTTFFPGNDLLADAGPEPPDHTFPDAARAHPVGSRTVHVDLDQPQRYAEVSNDWSAHHFDLESVWRAGFDDLFADGLCTMAMCTHAVVAWWRTATRHASAGSRCASPPHPPRRGPDRRRLRDPPTRYGFEATCAGPAVIKHGRLELFA